MLVHLAGAGHPVEEPPGHEGGIVGPGQVLHEDGELVAPDAGHEVGAARPRPQALRHRLQDGVPRRVAQAVVHRLEAVEVDEDEGAARALPPRAGEGALEGVEEEGAVGEAGEAVVAGEPLEVGLRPLPLQEEGEEAPGVGEGGQPIGVPRAHLVAAHLEDPHHLPPRPHGDGDRDPGLVRAGPDRRVLLEGAAGERVVGRGGKQGRRPAGGRPGQDGQRGLPLDAPEPRLRATQSLHERVEHRGGGLGQRQRGGEGVGRALAGGGQPLAPTPLAEVADVGGQDDAPLHVGGNDHHLDRHQRAVRAHEGRLAPAAEVRVLAGHHEVAQAPAQLVAQGGRDDGVGHLAAEDLGAACSRRGAGPRR